VAGNTCDILDDALLRYYRYLVLEREAAYTSRVGYRRKSNELPLGVKHFNPKATFRGSLATLDVDLRGFALSWHGRELSVVENSYLPHCS
jgi:hypothetical protein